MFRFVGSVSATLALLAALQAAPATAEIGKQVPAGVGAMADGPYAYPLRLRTSDFTAAARTPQEQALAEQVTALYVQGGFAPLWFDGKVLKPMAKAVMDEIGRAKEWGLDPAAVALPAPTHAAADEYALAAADARITHAVALYASHARGGRVDPSQLSKWLDQKPRPVDLAALFAELSQAADPAAVLRGLHPRHEGFHNLRKAYLKLLDPAALKTPDPGFETLPAAPRIEPGMRHPDIAIVRRRLGILATAYDETLYDDRLVAAVRDYMKLGRRSVKPVIDARVREALNNPPALAQARKPDSIDARKILVNMERWRWLPDDLGDMHIWNSLTEFETKVVKAGEVLHQERIIVGKPDTQTPVFSDRMEYLVFQPEWGVPNSIKVKQLLPALQDGNDGILDERGMKILLNGKEKDPGDYDWEKTDIRYVPVYQLPGPSNPLGQIKFMFPNKHDVYMHDTPQRTLFNDGKRTFSHGCIRVRNPRQLAELIMSIDQGWGASEVGAVLQPRSKPSNRIDLKTPIAVHNTYFTVFADAEGAVRSVPDIYSHDKRISDALDGVPVERIAERDPARVLERELEEIAPTGKQDGATVLLKTEKQKQAARKARALDDEGYYLPPSGKPGFQGYSGLTYAAPPKPVYYAPPPKPAYYAPQPSKKGNNFRSPPTIYDMVNSYGR